MLLCRLDVSAEVRSDILELGLRRHLSGPSTNSIISTIVQIGPRQQAYVSLQGCSGCVEGRCAPGCRVELLRRTIRAAYGAAGTLHLCSALADRPYRTLVIARPGTNAEPLTSRLLHSYKEARLMLHWCGGRNAQLTQSALLLTDADAHTTLSHLRDAGWLARSLPTYPKVVRFMSQPRSLPLPSTQGSYTPTLLSASARAPAISSTVMIG